MAVIAVEGMRFFAHHGVYEAEHVQGNHFEVDVWMDVGDAPLTDSDDLTQALDYGKVHAIATAVMAVRKNLLESLVNAMGRKLMAEFPGAKAITVRVSKERPPIMGDCRRSYVEATFQP